VHISASTQLRRPLKYYLLPNKTVGGPKSRML
jgi:hypothetical protein